MEDICYTCNKRVVVGGISMCIYDIDDTDNIISGVDVSECPKLVDNSQCNELNISCRNVPACWYKNEQVFKSAVRRYEDVHKSRE